MISSGFRAAAAATVFVSVLVPVFADDKPASDGVLCSIVWDEQTTGGDTETTHAEFTITPTPPQPDGGFVVFASGTGNVTYKPKLPNCRVVMDFPWIANFTLSITSDDGKTAEVDINSLDEPHIIVEPCGQTKLTVEPTALTGVVVPLKEGVTKYPYRNGEGAYQPQASGTVALHYCSR